MFQLITTNTCSNDRDEVYKRFRNFLDESDKGSGSFISSSPIRFPGTRSLAAKRAYYTRLAFKPGIQTAAISLIVPPEICWAAGYVPFNWEMFSSLLASHSKVIHLSNRGAAPVPRCSFINSLKGAYLAGILPTPDIMISSTAFCESISHMFGELAAHSGTTHYHLDLNGYLNPVTVSNLASQISDVFHSMCRLNNISPEKGVENLRKVMYYSSLAKKEYLDICRLRQEHAPLNLGLEPLHWHFLFSAMWGEESAYHICRVLKENILQAVGQDEPDSNENSIPISIFSLIPYGHTNIWQKIIQAGVYTTFEGVNFLGDYVFPDFMNIMKMTEEDLIENIAYNLLNTPMRGLDQMRKTSEFMKGAAGSGAKGMLVFTHEHCQMLAPRLDEIERAATNHGMKVACISGDCILGMPQGPTGIRLGTFINTLVERKPDNMLDKVGKTPQNNKPGMRAGIDFGSGYSKYVVIDKECMPMKSGIVTSGIDYPSLLHKIREKVINGEELHFGISGVGGDNPAFSKLVTHQTTEINALIRAINQLYAGKGNYTVVDIGTQDVKILNFSEKETNPWINTNKSCGAGTGMVLVQILDRWQQTRPGITFDDLDQMASEASGSELINTTCGIFAVTNVVSALVQSDEMRRKSVLRGVYQYIAEQAIKLMPASEKQGGRIILTGGLANHKTLQAIFTGRGFSLIPLPDFIHPQFMVAYGTALSIA